MSRGIIGLAWLLVSNRYPVTEKTRFIHALVNLTYRNGTKVNANYYYKKASNYFSGQ
jgi:hypothetical protein